MSKSAFDNMNDFIPAEITRRDEVITYLLTKGIYIAKDTPLPMNDLCNHTDHRIIDMGKAVSGHAAHRGWNEIAAENKIFGLLSEARHIQDGGKFSINKSSGDR